MASSFIPKGTNIVADDPEDVFSVAVPHMYNVRQCPGCGNMMFGMPARNADASVAGGPGGRDAHCTTCGFKDPCCND